MFNRVTSDEDDEDRMNPLEDDDDREDFLPPKGEEANLSIASLAEMAKRKPPESSDTDKRLAALSRNVKSPPPKAVEDDYDDDDDDDDDSPTKSASIYQWITEHLKGVITLVVLILLLLGNLGLKALFKKPSKPVVEVQSSSSVEVKQAEPEKNNTNNGVLMYEEYTEVPQEVYTDEMVVSKFFEVSETTCTYYFTGIPIHFKQKITFPVTYTQYNKVASGGKIFIDYKIKSIDGKDKVVDVTPTIGG